MTNNKNTKQVNMKYPSDLIEQIEKYQHDNFFTTRSAAIIYLINKAIQAEGYKPTDNNKN